jgi:hypothetical protein
MRYWQGFTHFLAIIATLSLLLCKTATSQDQKAPQSTFDLHSIKPPEHPITEQQLRTFFEVTHFLSGHRQRIHEQLEVLRKQMPGWYPQSVWDEIASSVEDMDVIAVALPVYQKYISEDDERFLNRFLATPQGQKVAQAVMAKKAEQGQRANAESEAADDRAIAELVRNGGAEVQRTLSDMSPEELREVKSLTAHWKQLQPVLWQMQGEVSQAIAAKQVELARTIKARHRAELIEAKRSYDVSHTSAPNSQTPQ